MFSFLSNLLVQHNYQVRPDTKETSFNSVVLLHQTIPFPIILLNRLNRSKEILRNDLIKFNLKFEIKANEHFSINNCMLSIRTQIKLN